MSFIDSFNKTLNYIESMLDGDIDERTVYRLSGYSMSMFSRLFSVFTGLGVSEYIRSRKLTKAAFDVKESEEKIIDIALKYGYESADSFSQAFKKMHGATPSEVRLGSGFNIVSPLILALSIRGGKEMQVKIERKPAFIVGGIEKRNITSDVCPSVWDELFEKHDIESLLALGSGESFGVCRDTNACDKINYMAGFDVKDVEKARALGLDIIETQETDYAVVSLKGKIPSCIQQGWRYIMEVFFPQNGLRHSGEPDFEVYTEGDMYSDSYEMELWVPVVKG